MHKYRLSGCLIINLPMLAGQVVSVVDHKKAVSALTAYQHLVGSVLPLLGHIRGRPSSLPESWDCHAQTSSPHCQRGQFRPPLARTEWVLHIMWSKIDTQDG